MHYSCDKTIGESELGGFLTFDSDLLPADHWNDCTVMVRPRKFGVDHGILFHLSDVDIGGTSIHCNDANLTVIDGQVQQWIYRQKLISGMHYENTPIQMYRKFHLQKLKIFR